MNIYEMLVKHFGAQVKTAVALGVEQGTVSGWVRGKHGMNPVTALKAADLCPSLPGLSVPAA